MIFLSLHEAYLAWYIIWKVVLIFYLPQYKLHVLTLPLQIYWYRQQIESARGPRPKIIFYAILVEGKQSYQMLFTRSKNIDLSRIYRIFKIAKYIQLPCGRVLYSRLSQNFKF